jgi:hypothetical protein
MRYMHKEGEPFSVKGIVEATEANLTTVRNFFLLLSKAGMIRPDGYARKHGKLWMLAEDFGPKPPVEKQNGMYDPNSGKLFKNTNRSVAMATKAPACRAMGIAGAEAGRPLSAKASAKKASNKGPALDIKEALCAVLGQVFSQELSMALGAAIEQAVNKAFEQKAKELCHING